MYLNEINDVRVAQDFRGISFSKFQKIKVKKELINCLLSKKIESACYWTAELICAGHYSDLWDIIILYISKYIHLGNPKLPIYINIRFDKFKEIIMNGYINYELAMRNNQKIRQLFGEIISVLCLSKRKYSIEAVKINKEDDFDMMNMSSKLEANSLEYATCIYKPDDPKDFFISINELAYHISNKSNNAVYACYWLEWLLEYENICKKKKEECYCERREFAPVLDKYQKDSIWIIWDIILTETNKKNNKVLKKIINSLLNIFSIRYTNSVKKKRKYILYFAISLLVEDVNENIEIIENINQVENIVKKINIVYKDVKVNEISPNTDYLLVNNRKSNLDKTIERLEKLNNLNKQNELNNQN
tara:strand:+ start:2035 stop:3117 length:1083 start_codon:yes stop_codon:yes gene_type:complete